MSRIVSIVGREILDSRGHPTVEADVILSNGILGRAAVPSGASTGSSEASELRDRDNPRYLGKGVLKAVGNINAVISPSLVGQDTTEQNVIDDIMIKLDGTKNKSFLGANAILAVSLAASKAAAKYKGIYLYEHIAILHGTPGNYSIPVPIMNVINGGVHANNNIDLQEFMIHPVNPVSFSEGLRMGVEIFQHLKKLLHSHGFSTSVGDEGGFSPLLESSSAALDLLSEAIGNSSYILGSDVKLSLDCASSEFYKNGKYYLVGEGKTFDSEQFSNYLKKLTNKYPISSIEDGMSESDWIGWKILTKKMGNSVRLVGDDLFATNIKLLKKGIDNQIGNSILIKPNQIGTLTETIATIHMAKSAGYEVIVSHRSGETEDSTIADLAVGTSSGFIKTGSLCRSERTAKYNQLLRIEEHLSKNLSV